jgi:hypothetical protein
MDAPNSSIQNSTTKVSYKNKTTNELDLIEIEKAPGLVI